MHAFELFCINGRILREFTVPHTPQHNGVVERKIQIVLNCIRSMLLHSGLNAQFSAEDGHPMRPCCGCAARCWRLDCNEQCCVERILWWLRRMGAATVGRVIEARNSGAFGGVSVFEAAEFNLLRLPAPVARRLQSRIVRLLYTLEYYGRWLNPPPPLLLLLVLLLCLLLQHINLYLITSSSSSSSSSSTTAVRHPGLPLFLARVMKF